jgi:putative transcriptional regulator
MRGSALRSRAFAWVLLVTSALVAVASPSILCAEGTGAQKAGCYFLVARDDMSDPTFQQTVILMVPSAPDNPLVAGVIVNKPTEVTLGRLFERLPGLKHPTEKVYYGGPVDDDEPLLFVRGSHPSKGTMRLMDDLYTDTSVALIADTLTHPWSPQSSRLYVGRAQWTRDQLQSEILQGAWDAMPADVNLIFKSDAGAVWRSLEKHSHLREVDFTAKDWALSELASLFMFRGSSSSGLKNF